MRRVTVLLAATAWTGGAFAAPPGSGLQQDQPALQEVIVSATKQGTQNVQSVPMAISVVNTESLDRLGISSLSGFVNSVPSISEQQYGPGQNAFAIRGIADPNGIDATNLVDQSLVSVYLDDTPISLQGATPDLKVFDLERVEVIRGPQGTLYGASAMAGTIRFITQKPDPTRFFGYGEGSLSDMAGGGANYDIRAMTNIPLVPDRLALRLSGYGGRDAGWIDNIGTGQKNANSVDTAQFRAAVRLEASSRFTLDGSVTHARTDANGNNDTYSDLGNHTFASLVPEYYHDSLTIWNATAHADLGVADLVSSTSYTDRTIGNLADFSYFDSHLIFGDQLTPAPDVIDNRIHDLVEELRLSSKGPGPLKWIAGVYYDHSIRHYVQNNPAQGLDALIGVPALAFDAPIPDDVFYGNETLYQREIAGFGQLTYTLGRLDLTAGARYFNYRQEYKLFFGGVAGSLAPGAPLVQNGTGTESGTNPRVELTYHVSPHSIVFAEAAKGYRYGGVNQPVPLSFCGAALASQGLSGPAPLTFGPDQLWSYSLGEKSTVAGGRATLDATGFFIDWRGMQTNDNLSCGYYFTQNAGHVTSKGIEFQGTARVTQRLNVSLSGSFTDATAAAPIANLGAPAGESVPYFPKYIINGSIQYRWPLAGARSLLFEADDQYRGETYNDFDPSIRRLIPASNVVNAAVTYDIGRWELGLYARNLTNEHVVTSVAANQNGPLQPGDTYYFAPPRVVGLRARVDF